MENFIQFIEMLGGILSSIIVIVFFVKIIIYPFLAKLEVKLTADIFFRLVNQGEVFFPKIIVYSPVNIQITNCAFELKSKKPKTQETSYQCKAELFGSVERNPVGELSLPSSYFPKRSPEFLLGEGETKEILIQCNIMGSRDKIEGSIRKLFSQYIEILKQGGIEENNAEFDKCLSTCVTNVLSNIKVESGKHTLICNIDYKYRHFFIPLSKKVKSEISINITEDELEKYKDEKCIEGFLMDRLVSFNKSNVKIRFPEIYPNFQ